jgi:hypothetical protein
MDAIVTRQGLRHVRFIGGGSGGGKSTIARRLAAKRGLRLHPTEPLSRFAGRLSESDAPLLHAFIAMDMDERWLNRSPEVMRDTFHGFHGESFGLLVDELLALPTSPEVLVEGFVLLPRLVAPLLSRPDQAVWLLPTPAFRRLAFESRGSTYEIPGKTSDPERALENLLARDRLFTQDVAREAAALGLTSVRVDVGLSVESLERRVAAALGLSPHDDGA